MGTSWTAGRIVDATLAKHVPPPFPMGPYTIVRGHVNLPILTSTGVGFNNVWLFSPHNVSFSGTSFLGGDVISPQIGTGGGGTNVPGTTELPVLDAVIQPYAAALNATVAHCNLHALTVVINCLETANTASGQIYVGALNQAIKRTRFATWNDLASSLISRREMKPISAYSCLTKPAKVSAYPVDMVEWASQRPLVAADADPADNSSMDTLSQLAIVLPPTPNVVQYSITIFTEWRVNFVDPALASTATKHNSTPMATWDTVQHMGSTLSGWFHGAEQGVNALGGALTAGMNLVHAGSSLFRNPRVLALTAG